MAGRRNRGNAVARAVCAVALAWMLCFPIFGGTSFGKSSFRRLSSIVLFTHAKNSVKGGAILITLVCPLLVAAALSALLFTRDDEKQRQRQQQQMQQRQRRRTSLLCRILPGWLLRCWRRPSVASNPSDGGEPNWHKQSCLFVLLPCAIYVAVSIHRHLGGGKMHMASTDSKLDHVGNSFGVMALIAGSMMLIPVSKQSPIVALWGWEPVSFTVVHIWAGRVFVIGAMLHGFFHISRWVWVADESLLRMIIPPHQCWATVDDGGEDRFRPTCHNETTACTCYNLFRNMTGFLAVSFMAILIVTSIDSVRRTSYALFYSCHVVAAPLALAMTIMHYNKAVLYLAPSLLYYLATTVPTWIESNARTVLGGKARSVHIVSATTLASGQGRPCVSLTVETDEQTWQSYYPGAFVKLRVPQVSRMSHPFTINKVFKLPSSSSAAAAAIEDGGASQPTATANTQNAAEMDLSDDEVATATESKQLRIIFRSTGPFTKQLLTLCGQHDHLPPMYVDGFHGTRQRVEQILSHDNVTIVAAGIGITPYLSLLHEVAEFHHRCGNVAQNDGISKQQQPSEHTAVKNVVTVHWMCRDSKLIEYVTDEYFETLKCNYQEPEHHHHHQVHSSNADQAQSRVHIAIVIHNTSTTANGDDHGNTAVRSELDVHENFRDDIDDARMHEDDTTNTAKTGGMLDAMPFSSTHFSSGSTASIRNNAFVFSSFIVTGWLGLFILWQFYVNVQRDHEVSQRIYGIIVVTIVSLAASYALHKLALHFHADFFLHRHHHHHSSEWDPSLMYAGSFEPVTTDDILDRPGRDGVDKSLEMTALGNGGIQASSSDGSNRNNNDNDAMSVSTDATLQHSNREEQHIQPAAVTVQLREEFGRPTLEALLKGVLGEEGSADDDPMIREYPALFYCVPSSLEHELLAYAKDFGNYDRIHTYPESFAI